MGFTPNIPYGGNDKGSGGGPGGVSQSDSAISLIDDQGLGVFVPFVLVVSNDGNGVKTYTTTTTNGAPYVPVGTVTNAFELYAFATTTFTEQQVNGVGNTTANIKKLSVLNTGASNGIFNGVILEPGRGREYDSYIDPNTKEFVRIPAIAYDATGTQFDISETV